MLGVLRDGAVLAQDRELLRQLLQIPDARGHLFDMGVEQAVDFLARCCRGVLAPQEHTDLAQRHVERAAVADEAEPFDMFGAVETVIATAARRRRQQALALVVADRVDGGLRAGSVSLLADAVDFFGDAVNYGVSLLVLGMALRWRARAALLKGLTMGAFGLFVLGRALWVALGGAAPEPWTMGAVGAVALLANMGVAWMLYAWREGDANMRSVWLCSRNDAIGNLAVVAAAVGVFGTGMAWPDLAVAAVMAVLALTAARSVVRQAWAELHPVPVRA